MNKRIDILIIPILLLLLAMKMDHSQVLKSQVTAFDVDMFAHVVYAQGPRVSLLTKENEPEIWYENLSYGNITSLNADKSLNVMLYYEDVQKIIFLDNKLSVKYSPIELSDLGLAFTPLACISYNTGFWVYDPTELEAVRYNRHLDQTHNTGNISQLYSAKYTPDKMKEFNNYLILKDSLQGLMLFDRYGGYVSFLPFAGVDDYQVVNEELFMLRSDTLYRMDMKTKHLDTLNLQTVNLQSFKYLNSSLYTLESSGKLSKISLP
jgi:hypothetical protein